LLERHKSSLNYINITAACSRLVKINEDASQALPVIASLGEKLLEDKSMLREGTHGAMCILRACGKYGHYDRNLFQLLVAGVQEQLRYLKPYEVVFVVEAVASVPHPWRTQLIGEEQVGQSRNRACVFVFACIFARIY
jgi:hypothetical protein